jgi:hypothetical protein
MLFDRAWGQAQGIRPPRNYAPEQVKLIEEALLHEVLPPTEDE